MRYDAGRPYHLISGSISPPLRRRWNAVSAVLTGSRLGARDATVCRRDDVATAFARVADRRPTPSVDDQVLHLTGNASHGGGGDEHAQFVAPLVLGVHRQEAQDEEVHRSRDHGQTHQDKEDAEDDVAWTGLQVSFRLQRNHVAEPDRRQRYDAVVD